MRGAPRDGGTAGPGTRGWLLAPCLLLLLVLPDKRPRGDAPAAPGRPRGGKRDVAPLGDTALSSLPWPCPAASPLYFSLGNFAQSLAVTRCPWGPRTKTSARRLRVPVAPAGCSPQ